MRLLTRMATSIILAIILIVVAGFTPLGGGDMARCADCNRFVSYEGNEEPEVDESDFTVEQSEDFSVDSPTGEITVIGTADRVLNCMECGSELKRASLDLEATAEFTHDSVCPAILPEDHEDHAEPDFEIEPEFTAMERVQTKDRHGKQIKSHRYMRTFYGMEGAVNVKCVFCMKEVSVSMEAEEQASAFEESF